MKTLQLTLETVTPLFLGGANPRGEPELRPPAFRGAMRYWSRAAMGGVIGDENLKGLRLLEENVFGSTETGSPISIQVRGQPQSSRHYILPHKTSGPRLAILPKQKFTLTLRLNHPAISAEDEVLWVNVCMALNLMLLFGGVGLRSRRGFGGLRVIQSSDRKLVPVTPKSLERWQQYVGWVPRNATKYARYLAQLNKIPPTSLPSSPTNFPCAAQNATVRISDNFSKNTTEEALKDMMSVMPHKSYLGGIHPRQASPLWIRVFIADGRYHLLLCVLPSELKSGTNYSALSNFLDRYFPGNDISIKGWNHD